MLRKIALTVGAAVLGLTVCTRPALADPVLDFKTGLSPDFGTIIVDPNTGEVRGFQIAIGALSVSGDPGHDGVYVVTGECGGSGCLTFDTSNPGGVGIRIDGEIPQLGINTLAELMFGAFTSWGFVDGDEGGIFNANGVDHKADSLIAALGLTGLVLPDWRILAGSITGFCNNPDDDGNCVDHTYTGHSSDIPNHSTAVPEPASMLLLGSGLVGVARSVRRRTAKS